MIYLNLIPSNLWFINLRSMLSKKEWDNLSLKIRELSNWECYCCHRNLNQLKNKNYFHAHEYWKFDNQKKCFNLACIVCVCYKCHQVIHFGYSSAKVDKRKLISWLSYVNKWSYQEANLYLEGCFEEWSYNSTINWTFNKQSLNDWLNNDEITKCINFLNEKRIKII